MSIEGVIAVVILAVVIGVVLAFATWIGRMLLAEHRESQRIEANHQRWKLAESINWLEHDLGLHATPEESCRSCQYDRLGWMLPVHPDRQRR